jgi:hypothetical protein
MRNRPWGAKKAKDEPARLQNTKKCNGNETVRFSGRRCLAHPAEASMLRVAGHWLLDVGFTQMTF